jgi:hypothetical protein
VRAWFNAQITHETVARGREAVEKLLQREGKTAIKLDDLASQLGFKSADDLFEVVGKDEFSLRNIETLLRPPEPVLPGQDDGAAHQEGARQREVGKGGVLVVGVDSLMTQLAKCCKPAPPDAIAASSRAARASASTAATAATSARWPRAAGARDRGGMGRAEEGRRRARSTRWTWPSRRPTARACCAISPKCSPRRR